MKVNHIEKKEVDKFFETEVVSQEPSAEVLNQLKEGIFNAVFYEGRTPHKLIDLLDSNIDKFDLIRKFVIEEVVKIAASNEGCGKDIMTILLDQFKDEVRKSISDGVVEAAAKNEVCGQQIMTMLLDQLKDEVCKSISKKVIKATAGNLRYGKQLTEQLLKTREDLVWENISEVAIYAAARNTESGASILKLLLDANKETMEKLICEVFEDAKGGHKWIADIVQRLKQRLTEIPYTIGYPAFSGGEPVMQRAPRGQPRYQAEV